MILNSLFPDTGYAYESGGDPEVIPTLSYEQFLDFHRTYYHPSNSYIYLYGDMDVEERLLWMDREYLSRFTIQQVDSAIALQKPFAAMQRVEKQYSIAQGEEEKDNTYLSYNKSYLAPAWIRSCIWRSRCWSMCCWGLPAHR